MRYHLAIAYIETDEQARAKEVLSELIKIDPSYWDAYYKLGELLIAEGQHDAAQQILEKLLEKNPDYERRNEVESMISSS